MTGRPIVIDGTDTGYVVYEDGSTTGRRGRVLAKCPNSRGYEVVSIWLRGGARTSRHTHVLVADAFLGPRPDRFEVNHIDGDKRNNSVGNLEYVSHSKNVCHAVGMGLLRPPRGERSGTAKLTRVQVRCLRKLTECGVTQRRASEWFGVSQSQVSRIARGERWAHVA